MKRYLVFAGDTYYPGGGWDDYRSMHDSLEETRAAVKALYTEYDWQQVVDTDTMLVVENAVLPLARSEP